MNQFPESKIISDRIGFFESITIIILRKKKTWLLPRGKRRHCVTKETTYEILSNEFKIEKKELKLNEMPHGQKMQFGERLIKEVG